MTLDNDDLLNSILASLERIDNIKLDELPNIDLYMDQLTTFMDGRLRKTTRYPDDDKILTKTMINNYAKNDLLPPPVRKKYSRDHVILLLFIYYYKSILSINDIQTLLEPLNSKFHISEDGNITLSDVYKEIYEMEEEHLESFRDDIIKNFEKSQTTFEDAAESEKEKLQMFSFISLLSYDIFLKKLIIEKMLDNFAAKNKTAEELKKAEKKHKEKKKDKNSSKE
ncbi:MAG: DUF1836 domain-containing protein [Butyrivibrio sp.]|jgi:hypothetical protein|nr:DUF1836 domain-containing protein [Butyrivibrio sp.]